MDTEAPPSSFDHLNLITDAALIHQDGIILFVNKVISKKFGLTEAKIIGQHVLSFIHPDDHDQVKNQITTNTKTEKKEEYEAYIRIKGFPDRKALVRTTSVNFNGQPSTLAILIEINSQKNVGEALLESEEKFRRLAETTPFAIMIHQEDHFIYTNPAGEKITGRTADEIYAMKFWELVTPEYQPLIRERGKKRQLGEQVPTSYEFQIQHKSGHAVWVMLNGGRMFYKGKPAGLVSIADISKRKAFEEQLNEQTARMNAVLAALPDLLFVCDRDGTFLEFFAQSTSLFAIPPEKVKGSNIRDIYDPQESERQLVAFRKCLDEQKTVTIEYALILNEKQHYFEARLSPIDQNRLLTIVRDITQSTMLNQQIEYLSQLQQLLTKLSNKFINIDASHVDEAIAEAIKEIGEFTQVDRVYIFEYLWEKQIMTNTYEWCAEGITPEIENLKSVPNNMIPEWVNAHKKGETIDIPQVNALDPESNLRKILEPQGIKSLTTLPMIYEEKCLGYIGLDAVKQERIWTTQETTILKLVAELLTNLHVKAAVNKKLRSVEATNAFITDNIADAVILTDAQGIYTYISPSHKRITGRGDEILGKSIFEHIHPDDITLVKQTFNKGKQSNKEYSVNYRYLHPQQGYIWIESTGKRYFDEDGQIFGLFTSRNIQERKTAEFELLKLSRAIEQSSASVIITDILGHIEYVNPAFCNNTGYSFEEVKGKNPRLLKSGHTTAETYQKLWQTIKSGGSWRGTFKTKRKDGSFFWEAANISPVIDNQGNISHFLAIKEDITEQRKIRNELIKAKEQAEESNRLKTAFINNISHEIRTPLNGIVGFAELLVDQDIPRDEKNEYLRVLNQSSNRLIKTVSDIMEVSLLVSGNKQIYPVQFQLTDLLHEIQETFESQCHKKNIAFEVTLQSDCNQKSCLTDRSMVLKILTELIGNAIKYTEKGFVKLNCMAIDANLNFLIEDSGSGIPEKYREKVFEYFSQADNSENRGYEGSGLGLSIAREMANLLGGTLSLHATSEKGSTFYLHIPCSSIVAPLSLPDERKENSQKNRGAILIVEDDEVNYLYLSKILNPEQRSRTIWTTNGMEAVDLCSTNKDISLVLMDIKLPGLNGYEATRKIKEQRPDISVIAVTAYAMEADQEKAIQAGCDDFLSKPFSKNELQQKLQKSGIHE
jgi:PAS domain S-box-containing protein